MINLKEDTGGADASGLQQHGFKNIISEQRAGNKRPDDRRALATLISEGEPYHMAWASVRENWMFLPDEKTMPNLGEVPEPPDGDLGTSDYWGTDEEE